MKTTTREKLEAKLAKKCAKLYDARTSASVRSTLSLEVSIIRARLLNVRDPLAAMTRASESAEEE